MLITIRNLYSYPYKHSLDVEPSDTIENIKEKMCMDMMLGLIIFLYFLLENCEKTIELYLIIIFRKNVLLMLDTCSN